MSLAKTSNTHNRLSASPDMSWNSSRPMGQAFPQSPFFRDQGRRTKKKQSDFCRRLRSRTFSPSLTPHFDRDCRHFLNRNRIPANVGSAERRKGVDVDCPICRDLEHAYKAELSEYIEARSSAYYGVCTELAAQKNVDVERTRYELEEHRLVCIAAVRAFPLLLERDESASLKQLTA